MSRNSCGSASNGNVLALSTCIFRILLKARWNSWYRRPTSITKAETMMLLAIPSTSSAGSPLLMNVALFATQGCPLFTDWYMVAEKSPFSDMCCRSGPVQGTMFCSECGVNVRGLRYCVQLVCKVRVMVRDFNVRVTGCAGRGVRGRQSARS